MNAEFLQPEGSYPTEKDEIVRTHMKLIHKLAQRFRWAISGSIDYQDIVSEGMIGLLQAHKRYDKGRGVKFSTFAIPRIMGSIRNFIRDRGMGIRPPQRLYHRTGSIIKSGLSHSTSLEVSASLGCNLKQAGESLRYLRNSKVVYLDKPLTNANGGSDLALIDTLALKTDESQEFVDAFVGSLDEVERNLIELRMDQFPLKKIVQQLQKSPEEIHQMLITLGEKFGSFTEIKIEREVDLMAELTKEKYIELKKVQDLPDSKICKMFFMGASALNRMKQKWGIVGTSEARNSSARGVTGSLYVKQPAISNESKVELVTDEKRLGSVDWEKKYYDLHQKIPNVTELVDQLAWVNKENDLLKALLKNYL
ncbi:MAG: sigma-70 family RNA polymerase sigma factor [Paenibacillaceae bacterium]